MLPDQLLATFLDGLRAAQVEQAFEYRPSASRFDELLVPGRELVRLDDVAGVEASGGRALDDGLGVQHHHVVHIWQSLDAPHYVLPLQQLGQNPFMASTLLDGGLDPELFVPVSK